MSLALSKLIAKELAEHWVVKHLRLLIPFGLYNF